jgi:hypothetical protein
MDTAAAANIRITSTTSPARTFQVLALVLLFVVIGHRLGSNGWLKHVDYFIIKAGISRLTDIKGAAGR